MRIAQVVTYVSPDRAFGGPVTVALGQAEALAARGHEVTVFAAAPIDEPVSRHENGFILRLFPARRLPGLRGFAGMRAVGMRRELANVASQFDVAHIHLARDLVTLPAASAIRRAGIPFLVQPHGMIDHSRNPLAGPLDLLATRPTLRAAYGVLTLTEREGHDILGVERGARTISIRNGIRLVESGRDVPPQSDRVLFLARLQERKRPQTFIAAARLLVDRHPHIEFVLAGPDEGEGDAVRESLRRDNAGGRITWIGAVPPDETDALMKNSRVYVLPSVGEVFPMTILEAFRAGTPVVATTSLGIARECQEYGSALLTDPSPESIAEGVSRVLTSPEVAAGLRAGAHAHIRDLLGIEQVAEQLEILYLEASQAERRV